jgi:hypothetical protein
MSVCDDLDPFITPYVDGEVREEERAAVAGHLAHCSACRVRVEAEATARHVLRAHAAISRTMGVAPPWRPRTYRLGQPSLVLHQPARIAALTVVLAAAVGFGAIWLRTDPALSAVGVIGDSFCGRRHVYTTADISDRACTQGCLDRGAEYVFVTDNEVYRISNQEFPGLGQYASARVEVTGKLSRTHLTIERISSGTATASHQD